MTTNDDNKILRPAYRQSITLGSLGRIQYQLLRFNKVFTVINSQFSRDMTHIPQAYLESPYDKSSVCSQYYDIALPLPWRSYPKLSSSKYQRSRVSDHLCSYKGPVIICWHDDVIKWKHFPHYWPFVRGIHRSPVNSLHKGQWREALMFSLICA